MTKNERRLRRLDALCEEANSLWHKLEAFKLELAREAGISTDGLRRLGVHVEGGEDA